MRMTQIFSCHLDEDENPGQTDGYKERTDHGQCSTGETEADKSKCFWNTLKEQTNQHLETLERGF